MKNTNEEKKMIKVLSTSSKKILAINNHRTKSMLDMHHRGNSYFIELDWIDEVTCNYKFYISMIGFIEAHIIDTANKIKKENNKTNLDKLIASLEDLMKKRNKIVNYYLENSIQNDLPIVKEILKSQFIYTELSRIYADLEVENNKYQLHQSFVQAYNTGSQLANNCDFRTIYLTFTKLWLSNRKVKIQNEQKINDTGNAKNLKKFISYKNTISKNRED